MQTVSHVDVDRYAGTWYEFAANPEWFERGCTSTTATYLLRQGGDLDVLNRCRKGALGRPEDDSKGRARVVDRTTNAKVEVSFFRPFCGDYWIVDLGSQYEYAAVGAPGRDCLWIPCLTPGLDSQVYDRLVGRLRDRGYAVDQLVRTLQPGG